MITTPAAIHETATQQLNHEQRQAWEPVTGQWLPYRDVYGFDPDAPIDDDVETATTFTFDPPSACLQQLAAEVGLLAIIAAAVDRDRAFRARPVEVRRALVTRHRRAARRARRHARLTRSSR